MGSVVKIKPGGLAAQIRATGKAGRKALQRASWRASLRSVGVLKSKTPVDEGVARAAWAAKRYPGGLVYIENSAPHIGILLKGARPHAVNAEGVAAIREWVIRKGLVQLLQPLKKGHQGPQRVRKLSRGQAEGEFAYLVDEIVWAIVNKLKKYGYKGHDFVEEAMPQMVAYLDIEVAMELAKVVQNPNGGEA